MAASPSPRTWRRLCAELHAAWKRRDLDTVDELNDRLMPLHQALFIESSPGPVKFAAKLLGHCDDEVRLPLVRIQPETQVRVRAAMAHAGHINQPRPDRKSAVWGKQVSGRVGTRSTHNIK